MAVIALETNVRVIAMTNNIRALISSAVRYWGRDRMVARLRHLAEQSRLLHRTPAHYTDYRYVSAHAPIRQSDL